MDNLNDILKKLLVIAIYIIAILLWIGGITAIAGIPLGVLAYKLKQTLNVDL